MLSVRQFIILALALVAAVAAILVIRSNSGGGAAEAEQVAAPVPGQNVLVATRDLPQGALLASADFEWRNYADNIVADSFVTETATPDALTSLIGNVTRRAIAAGEPIQNTAIIAPGEGGVMAAQVPVGYRAVAVEISDASAVGGFIQPNDRVDVILTTTTSIETPGGGSRDEVRTDVILEDVRVLAVGSVARAEAPDPEAGQEPNDGGTAVLELSQRDSRTIAMAEQLGDLRLALRGVEAEPPGTEVTSAQRWRSRALEQSPDQGSSVRIHAYGETGGAQ
jgi:pilus assembly protein CpaB